VPVEKDVDIGDGVIITMMLIPPGEFLMGSSDEEQARFLEEATAAENQFVIDRIPSEVPQHWVNDNDDTSRRFKPGLHEVDGTDFVFELSQPFATSRTVR
jgi:hypothetical protein